VPSAFSGDLVKSSYDTSDVHHISVELQHNQLNTNNASNQLLKVKFPKFLFNSKSQVCGLFKDFQKLPI